MLKAMGAVGSGVLYAVGSPNSSLYNALLNLWDEEMRLWCYSSVMLALVAEGIEAGDFDAEKAQETAREKCEFNGNPENFLANVVISFGFGYASGNPEDYASDVLAGWLGTSSPGGKILIGAATSYFDPIPDWKDPAIHLTGDVIDAIQRHVR